MNTGSLEPAITDTDVVLIEMLFATIALFLTTAASSRITSRSLTVCQPNSPAFIMLGWFMVKHVRKAEFSASAPPSP